MNKMDITEEMSLEITVSDIDVMLCVAVVTHGCESDI